MRVGSTFHRRSVGLARFPFPQFVKREGQTLEKLPDASELSTAQLRHDVRGDLSVLTLGVEALMGIRDDDQQFRELIGMMRENVDSLKSKLEVLVERAGE